ncbi:MAG TPA: response regulator [Nitrospirales bacterium]|nr:response regulator [Nitrospirales bacterium]
MANPSILIVDDDTALLQALPETVRTRIDRVVVDTCDSARAALDLIAQRDYDVIITDIKMPAMDGLVLLGEIKKMRPQTPTLLITGHGEHELAVQGLRGGAYDFIQKPIDRDYFIASVGRALKVRELSRRIEEQQEALARHNEELKRSRQELRALAARLLTVQEEERRRLSFELHDDLNQKLAVLVMNTDALDRNLRGQSAQAREQLRALKASIVELSDDVRTLAYRLHPSILDHLGLVIALESQVEDFTKREKIRVTFSHRDVPEDLGQDISTCLYRVAQEGLRNITRHAKASHAELKLTYENSELRLRLKDNGQGFNPKDRTGLGLVSMQERARAVDGRFEITSEPGQGTTVTVTVPVKVNDAEMSATAQGEAP